MINTIGYVDVQPTAKFVPPPLTRIPSYPDLPMEDVFPREAQTDIAEVYFREVGAGRVAYFPGDVDSTFWEILDPDHGRILANTVRWALNEPDVVSVRGQGVLDVSAWEGDGLPRRAPRESHEPDDDERPTCARRFRPVHSN